MPAHLPHSLEFDLFSISLLLNHRREMLKERVLSGNRPLGHCGGLRWILLLDRVDELVELVGWCELVEGRMSLQTSVNWPEPGVGIGRKLGGHSDALDDEVPILVAQQEFQHFVSEFLWNRVHRIVLLALERYGFSLWEGTRETCNRELQVGRLGLTARQEQRRSL